MNGEPLLACASGDESVIVDVAAFAYSTNRYPRNATKRQRSLAKHKRQCQRVVPILLTALEEVRYSSYPTPGEVLDAEAKCRDACKSAIFNPVTLWLLGQLLSWLIPVMVRWWFSDRSQNRRIMAARAKGGL